MITSTPFENFQPKEEVVAEPTGDEENEENWKAKYEAEWLSSKSKHLFEIPSNSMISIHLRNGEAFWTYQKIHQLDMKQLSI
jgi:hypothetical protein